MITPQHGHLEAASEASRAASVRLLILSDLHLEFGAFTPPDPGIYDVVVLAGDIGTGPRAVKWAQRESTFGGKPVVLVPGNHEFYGTKRQRTLELLREAAAGSSVHLLDRDEVTLFGVRFLGATLWTDFRLDANSEADVIEAMDVAKKWMNDFWGLIGERRDVAGSGTSLFTPEDSVREHRQSRAWLQQRLDAPTDLGVFATVVVTHHGPSRHSVAPKYAGNALNPCFASDLPSSFFGRAVLWVHGHTHTSLDYVHHGTRVLTNPRGYVDRRGRAENSAFDPALVVTLSPGERHG